MPRPINLKEIAEKNPHLDLNKLEEWEQLKERLAEQGEITGRKRPRRATPFQRRRAQIVDDAQNDSRLIKLQRNR